MEGESWLTAATGFWELSLEMAGQLCLCIELVFRRANKPLLLCRPKAESVHLMDFYVLFLDSVRLQF